MLSNDKKTENGTKEKHVSKPSITCAPSACRFTVRCLLMPRLIRQRENRK